MITDAAGDAFTQAIRDAQPIYDHAPLWEALRLACAAAYTAGQQSVTGNPDPDRERHIYALGWADRSYHRVSDPHRHALAYRAALTLLDAHPDQLHADHEPERHAASNRIDAASHRSPHLVDRSGGSVARAGGVLTDASRDVLAERQRQISKGYTIEHDDRHDAATIVGFGGIPVNRQDPPTRQQMVRAAACLLAAIERLDRS